MTITLVPSTTPSGAYADAADLMAYLHVTEDALPADYERLLERASEDIDFYIQPNIIDTTNASQMELVVKATCAQVEYINNVGEDKTAYEGSVSAELVGRTMITYAAGSGGKPTIAPRAQRLLSQAGLTYRGVAMR
jgi:hypothetical protein